MKRQTANFSLAVARTVALGRSPAASTCLVTTTYHHHHHQQQVQQHSNRWLSGKSGNGANHTPNSSSSTDTSIVVDAEEWIRPDRPLVGDKGHSHLMFQDRVESSSSSTSGPHSSVPSMVEGEYYEDENLELARIERELEELERLEQEQKLVSSGATSSSTTISTQTTTKPLDQQFTHTTVDWLKTRRTVFGDQVVASKDETKQKRLRGELGLPILRHTLLSMSELTSILKTMGGTNITVLSNSHGRMGVGLDGMIVATATTSYQIRSMAVALIRQLRLRELGDCGVMGATMGTKRRSFSSDQTWLHVDCGNYEVHVMSPQARQFYQLERLWGEASDDPVLTLDCTDEVAVDRYLDDDFKEQQQREKANGGSSSQQYGFINGISNKNNTSWKEMYAKLQNVPKRKDVVVPITNPPQRRKKNNMNRWR